MMGENLLKHIEILKTVPGIKESIEELKFGCLLNIRESSKYEKFPGALSIYDCDKWERNRKGIIKIIGAEIYNYEKEGFIKKILNLELSPIGMELRKFEFLQGGCYTNLINYEDLYNGVKEGIIKIIGQIHEGHLRMFLEKKNMNVCYENGGYLQMDDGNMLELDNTKPYMEQSEEFFKKFNDWLIKEFNIKL